MTTHLPPVSFDDETRTHDTGRLNEAQDRFKKAYGSFGSRFKRTVQAVADQHSDRTEGTEAAAQLIEELTRFLSSNGLAITQQFAPKAVSGDDSGTTQVSQLKEELDTAINSRRELETKNETLSREAKDHSDEVAKLQQEHQQELAKVRRELQAEIDQLKSAAPKGGNPSQQMLDELKQRVETAERAGTDKDGEITKLKQDNQKLQADLNSARENLATAQAQVNNVVVWESYFLQLEEAHIPDPAERKFTLHTEAIKSADSNQGDNTKQDPPVSDSKKSTDNRSRIRKVRDAVTGNSPKKEGK